MARHPEWFERLDTIREVVREAAPEWLGRKEMRAVFQCSERDSIRLLHKFGAEDRNDALSLPRTSLLVQLDAIAAGPTYGAFLRQRQDVAKSLSAARAEAAARQFHVKHEESRMGFGDLPATIRLERGRLEVRFRDGGDLMRQLADFLAAAGTNREEFFEATEPRE